MNPKLKLALGIGAGVVIGGAVGYLVAGSRIGRKAFAAIDKEGYRLPDPSYAVEMPYSEEQFEVLDELVCECGAPLVKAASETTTIDELTNEIRLCMARELYPDFDWPPVTGDHPTASQLFSELGFVARKALISTEICPINDRGPA